jgi:RHS repeat-associated protein
MASGNRKRPGTARWSHREDARRAGANADERSRDREPTRASTPGYREAVSFNGNLTDDGTYAFEYDYKNQIVRVKEGETTVATYKYDALGRRVEKDVDSAVERFIYSGHETVVAYDGSNNWLREFVFGSVIDEVLMMEQADVLDFDNDENTSETTRSFYHRNALGSVMEITEMDEDVAVSYRYNPYGAVTITRNSEEQSSDPLGNPWMYTGRFNDEETGLYYYRARAYSPVTGRFLQRDPLGYGPGANLYAYCDASPAAHRDPLGLTRAAFDLGNGRGVYPRDGDYPVNPEVAESVVAEAESDRGDTSYEREGGSAGGSDWHGDPKCNLWVYTVLCRSGAWKPLCWYDWEWFPPGGAKYRMPTAHKWWDCCCQILGYEIVGNPQPGDVVSDGRHCGIVTESRRPRAGPWRKRAGPTARRTKQTRAIRTAAGIRQRTAGPRGGLTEKLEGYLETVMRPGSLCTAPPHGAFGP